MPTATYPMKPPSRLQNPFHELDLAGEPPPVALVVGTRQYNSLPLIEALVRNDFTAVERQGLTDGLHLAEKLRPALVVLLCDPTVTHSINAITAFAARTDAFILVVAPRNRGFAQALRAGADACLSDHDGSEALEAQVEAIHRRPQARSRRPPDVGTSEGPVRINVEARRIETAQARTHLTDSEMTILLYLGQHSGQVVTTLELLRAVTGRVGSELEAQRTIKVYVRRLRKKLAEVGLDPNVVANVRGHGYMLDVRARLE